MSELTTIEAAPRALQPVADADPAGRMMTLIERAATDPAFDVEKMQALLVMKKDHDAETARIAFNTAFAAFKGEAVRLIKNKTFDGNSPLKGKKYAELHAVINAVTPALSLHGLSASWKVTRDEKDWIEVTCTLRHVQGHSESVALGGPPDAGGAKNGIQARASTVSYLERYTLKAILGLAEQEDDTDGNAPKDTGVPAGLLNEALLTAKEGEAELKKWWAKRTPAERKSLLPSWESVKSAVPAKVAA